MEYIVLENVNKEYSNGNTKNTILNNINLTIKKGTVNIILGPSGAGKTTILNLIGGIDKITSGKIIVDNKVISDFKEKELTDYRKNYTSFVFQDYNLISNLTVLENLNLIKHLNKNSLDQYDILKKLSLDNTINKFPFELSGGERQRIAIARAIIKNSPIILCDEPTGALDSNNSNNVMELLLNTMKEYNKTLIIVTHNQEFTKYADKIINIIDGKIK